MWCHDVATLALHHVILMVELVNRMPASKSKNTKNNKRSKKNTKGGANSVIREMIALAIANNNPTKRPILKGPTVSKTKTTKLVPRLKRDLPLSECAARYLLASVDPFNPEANGSCIPIANNRSTLKARSILRVSMGAGTKGYGFVQFAPCVANDYPALFYTNGTYTGDSVDTNPLFITGSLAGGINAATVSNLPFKSTALISNSPEFASPTVYGRVVSVGIRITYTGALSATAGVYLWQVHPTHANMTAVSFATMYGDMLTGVRRIDDRTLELTINVKDESEAQFNRTGEITDTSTGQSNILESPSLFPMSNGQVLQSTGLPTTQTLIGGTPLIIRVGGCAAGASFDVQVVQHVEYMGIDANYGCTPSEIDTPGFSAAQDVIESSRSRQLVTPEKPLVEHVMSAVADVGSMLAKSALKQGVSWLSSHLSKPKASLLLMDG